MTCLGLLLLVVARAAEPAEPDVHVDPDVLEIVVVEEGDLDAARQRVVDELAALGWRARPRDDGTIGFRGPRSWMGRAFLRPTGDLDFHVPLLWASRRVFPNTKRYLWSPELATGKDWSRTDDDLRRRWAEATVGFVDLRSTRGVQREVASSVHDAVLDYRAKLQQYAFGRVLEALPDRLDACWLRGVPLDGGDPLLTPDARRAAILAFWATRTDTPEGHAVMAIVAAYVRNVVMIGPHAATPEELAAAEAQRDDGWRLVER